MSYPNITQPTMPVAPTGWVQDAACRDLDPGLFDPVEGTPEAHEACASCPVIAECRAHLIAWPDQAGYGAGMTEVERQTYRRTVGPKNLPTVTQRDAR